MRKLLSILLIINIHLLSFGVYLENVPHELVQPNGEVLNVFISGDEFYRRVHDKEGYSIVHGNDGWYYYALYDDVADELIPSELVVTATQRTDLPMEKGLGISHKKYIDLRREFLEPAGFDISGFPKNSILNNLANDGSKNTQQMNNIVICIGFSDTQNMTNSFSSVNGMFNSNPNNSMNDYFMKMSYGKLDIVSHFYPQPDGNILRYYKDSQPRDYYRPYHPSNNSIGYKPEQRIEREQTLLKNAVQFINAVDPVPRHLNLDIDNDGNCDFITFVVFGGVGGWNDLLWPHAWTLFAYDVRINGKRVFTYNFELDASPSYFNVGVFSHEGYHVLGAPDLYHYYPAEGLGQAVGLFDIMESTGSKPQSMSAYMKYKYGNWIPQLPIATPDKTYQVFPFYTNDGTDPEKPVIHRIPMTGLYTQYSLVEYRKKTGNNYEGVLPNEGLMIYRIHSAMHGNAGVNGESGFADEVFLYRPNSVQNGLFYNNGTLSQAPFNQANGRTEFNINTDPKPSSAYGQPDEEHNISYIDYHADNDSYTFYYGDPNKVDIKLNKDTLMIGKQAGASGAVKVISNVFWNVSIPGSAADWLKVLKPKGLNEDRVLFAALTENNTGAPKSTTVTFTGYGKTVTLVVIQDVVEYFCEDEVSNLNVNIHKEERMVTLSWSPPSKEQASKGSRNVLWDNTVGATSQIFQSTYWAGGDGYDFVILADDFDITDDVAWSITEISCSGARMGTPLPDYIGISIYRDNGNNLPGATIWENRELTPKEGVISGKMNITLPQPLVLYDMGKYWISIYGTYNGKPKNGSFGLTTTSMILGEKMCMWDPKGNVFPGFSTWTPTGTSLINGIYFSLTGEITHPDRVLYNVYLNDQLILADYKYNSLQYPAILSQDNKWCVVAVCTSSMEGNEVCVETKAIIYDFSLSPSPPDGGFVEYDGFPGHGENIVLNAYANDGFKFAGWSQNGITFSTDTPYSFEIIERKNIVGNFEIIIPFDKYAVVKWNNTLALNKKQLSLDGFEIANCRWFKSDEFVGEGYFYSAGNKITDLLEVGAAYSFSLGTFSHGKVHSTEKLISEEVSCFKVYPNPVPNGSKLIIEGAAESELVEIFNAMGACVLRTTATGNITELTLAVPAGIYLVRTNNEGVKVIIN